MKKRRLIRGVLALIALGIAGFGAWILSLPATSAVGPAPPVARSEMDAMLAALKPPKRTRPVIAVIGLNDATETTDYLMTTGILRRADVADVVMLAPGPGPVQLYPALKVEPDATIAQFDARHREGADYVIVPAMSRNDDPAVIAWIRSQAAKGSTIVGVCFGVKVVAEAGLLDGKRATTHWFARKKLFARHPAIQYVPDRRMVVDGRVATTTGITASAPMMLTLIEAIAGRPKAETVAAGLGLAGWDARHNSGAFAMTRAFTLTVTRNVMSFWNRERFGIALKPGVDEVSLALTADAWSRTYRSRVVTYASQSGAVRSAGGVRILPDEVVGSWPAAGHLTLAKGRAAEILNQTLARISDRYGAPTAAVVAMQLEYAGR